MHFKPQTSFPRYSSVITKVELKSTLKTASHMNVIYAMICDTYLTFVRSFLSVPLNDFFWA